MSPTTLLLLCAALVAGGTILAMRSDEAPAATKAVPAKPRPANWAQPVTLAGAPNLHKVGDTLYRGAQPTAEGMKNLSSMGVATVVSLRAFNSDEDELKGLSMRNHRIRMKTWHPEYEDVVKFLKIATDPAQAPVFVHCQHGADRTGTMCAIYRIAVQGWTKEEALREMREGGYGFHEIWGNLPAWIAKLDVGKLRKDAGIADPAAAKPADVQPSGAKPVASPEAGVVPAAVAP